MEREWLVTTNGKEYGPMSKDELALSLQQRRCSATDLFWRQGMPDWKPLAEIPELSDIASSVPPQAAQLPPLPGEISPEESELARKKIPAGILGIILGQFGIHKFILGYKKEGIIMLLVSVLGCWLVLPIVVMGIIGIIEGIMYLAASDEEFVRLHKNHSRPWF